MNEKKPETLNINDVVDSYQERLNSKEQELVMLSARNRQLTRELNECKHKLESLGK
jgi:hypothetical protein